MKAPLIVFCYATFTHMAMAQSEQFLPAVPPSQVQAVKAAKESFDRGDFKEAEKRYASLLVAIPDNLLVLSNLGVVRFRLGKLDLAAETLERAVALFPNDPYSSSTLGVIYYRQARYEDASKSFTRVLALDPQNATAHECLDLIHSHQAKHQHAP